MTRIREEEEELPNVPGSYTDLLETSDKDQVEKQKLDDEAGSTSWGANALSLRLSAMAMCTQ